MISSLEIASELLDKKALRIIKSFVQELNEESERIIFMSNCLNVKYEYTDDKGIKQTHIIKPTDKIIIERKEENGN
jgi:hypothetical protein